MSSALSLIGARASYGSVEVLHGVTMVFPTGTVIAIVGRNGAGKSTALRCLSGLLPLRSGSVRWRSEEINGLSPYERATRGMILVPDQRGVFSSLTVRENLELVARDGRFDAALQVYPELADRLPQRAGTLSGGEQQMLALCRAFLRPGGVILVDEVSRGLSPAATARTYEALKELVNDDRVIVIVEQYVEDVLRFATLVYVLTRGEVSFAGEPGELRSGLED
ncbi:MAG: ABC transporter ATP-binding protein [Acidimicrobiales bacterium]